MGSNAGAVFSFEPNNVGRANGLEDNETSGDGVSVNLMVCTVELNCPRITPGRSLVKSPRNFLEFLHLTSPLLSMDAL